MLFCQLFLSQAGPTPGSFLVNIFCLLLKHLHSPILCSNLFWAKDTGRTYVDSPTSLMSPDPSSSHFLKTDGKWWTQNPFGVHRMGNVETPWHTHHSHFSRHSRVTSCRPASQYLYFGPCQNYYYIFQFLGLLVNKYSQSNLLK